MSYPNYRFAGVKDNQKAEKCHDGSIQLYKYLLAYHKKQAFKAYGI